MRIVLLLLLAFLLAGCTRSADDPPGLDEDFENGIAAWGTGSDLPLDPNGEGRVNWNITPTPQWSHSGNWSIRFALDGRQDDGTIWIHREVDVPEGGEAEVSFWAWSRSESFNTLAHAVAYLGPEAPATEDDFPAPGEELAPNGAGGLRQPLDQAEGWREYAFRWRVPEGVERAHLAIGISAVWETEMVYPVDDIRVTFGA